MTLEEYKYKYPSLPEHFYKSAYDRCPWVPECDRGRAFMMGYLERCWEAYKGKQ